MTKKQTLLHFFIPLLFPAFTHAQTGKTAMDHLNIPGPVSFEKKIYKLNWSSHPADYFYKQEYLPAGEKAGQYKTMLLVDVVVSDKSVKEIAGQKMEELKQLKQTNPVVNYQIFDNPASGEYMIDFLLSANDANGNISIIERNVYRYKTFTDKSGKKGVLLFGVSIRSYGKEVDTFLAKLKTNKNELVDQVAKYSIPEISIKK